MNVIFRNISKDNRMTFFVQEQKYVVDAGSYVNVLSSDNKLVFTVDIEPVDLTDGIDDITAETFKGKVLKKLSKKFLQKLPDAALYTSVTYKLTGEYSNVTVEFDESAYSVLDGVIAEELFEMPPLIYAFAQGETAFGTLRAVKSKSLNKKRYRKLYTGLLLFVDWVLFLPNLLFFIPKLFVALFFMSDFFVSKLLAKLYKYSPEKRNLIIAQKSDIQSHRFKDYLKGIGIVLLVVVAGVLFYNLLTSDYDVIIAEDFQSIVCFDEVFVRMDGELPDDATKSFLEDYHAYYPLADGGYDTDNYYCYIYEDSEGNRYMWLKDGCAEDKNADKDYEDYENPIVYISIGEED